MVLAGSAFTPKRSRHSLLRRVKSSGRLREFTHASFLMFTMGLVLVIASAISSAPMLIILDIT
jgi:hypothetical protein